MADLSGVSTEDLLAYKSGDLSKVSTQGLMSLRGISSAPPPAPVAPSDPNYFQRVAQDWRDNYAANQAIDARQKSGDTGVLQATLQSAGHGPLGYAIAPFKEAVNEASNFATDQVAQGYAALPDSVTGALSPAVQGTSNALSGLGQHVQSYLADKPNLKSDLESLQNLVSVLPGLSAETSDLNTTAANAAKYGSPAPDITWKGAIPNSDAIHAEADKAYNFADSAGGGAMPQATNDFLAQANRVAAQDPDLLEAHGPDAAQKYLNELNTFQDKPMKLATAQAEDIALRENASQAYRAGNSDMGNRYSAMRQALRDNIYNQPDPSLITGGPEAFQALQEGNRLKSQALTVGKAEDLIAAGSKAEVPSTGIKQQFKAWAQDIDKNGAKGLSQDTVDAINEAGTTGALTGFMKGMGSKLGAAAGGAVGATLGTAIPIPIVGPVVGGMVGSGAGYVAGAPFRAGATALQLGKANDAIRSIIDRPTFTPPSLTEPIKPPPMLQLTNQRADTVARRYAASQRSNAVGPNRTAFGPDASTTGVNLQGVPYNTGAPGEPLGLPSPQSLSKTELATNSQGQNAWRTNEQQAGVNASRENDVATGMSQSVRQAIVKNAMSAKFGPAWDAIQGSEKSKILDQMDQMWDGKTPQSLQSMIDMAHQNIQDLNAASGTSKGINNFGEALRNALKVNFRSDTPSLKTIIPPQ